MDMTKYTLTDLDGNDGSVVRDLRSFSLSHSQSYAAPIPQSTAHQLNNLLHIRHPTALNIRRVCPQLTRRQTRRPERDPARGRLRIDVWPRAEDDEDARLGGGGPDRLEGAPVVEIEHARRGVREGPVDVDGDAVEACGDHLLEDVEPEGGHG